jgi:hypothetical protein
VTNRLATELSCALDRAAVDVKFGRAELFDPQTLVITDDIGKKETVTGTASSLQSDRDRPLQAMKKRGY